MPVAIEALLWIVAALSMTIGNALACLQTSVKRMMAYSSIAHSGYMLVGLIVGPGETFTNSGLAAVLYYLLCYGVMNTGVFAVIASLEKADGSEPDELSEISGLVRTHPVRGWIVIICTLSLLGFIGKVGLFSAGVSGGQIPLVVILGINSAIAAFYYLRLVTTVYLDPKDDDAEQPRPVPRGMSGRPFAATVSAAGVLGLIFLSNPLIQSAEAAATQGDPTLAGDEPAEEAQAVTLADPRD